MSVFDISFFLSQFLRFLAFRFSKTLCSRVYTYERTYCPTAWTTKVRTITNDTSCYRAYYHGRVNNHTLSGSRRLVNTNVLRDTRLREKSIHLFECPSPTRAFGVPQNAFLKRWRLRLSRTATVGGFVEYVFEIRWFRVRIGYFLGRIRYLLYVRHCRFEEKKIERK